MRSAAYALHRQRRPAFTLVELIVVIAIIVILIALTAAGYFYFVTSTQGRNTEGTIRTVNKVFQGQWAWVVEQAKKESPSQGVKDAATNTVANVPGCSDPGGERAKALWIKVRLMEAFPIAFSEINNNAAGNDPVFKFLYVDTGNGNPAIPSGQRKYISQYQRAIAINAAVNPATESSACLLMALAVSRGGSSLSPDLLGPAVMDTDQDGIPEIVDGWKKPLAFFRFAWGTGALSGAAGGIQGLNPAAAGSKGAKLGDPLDPGGALASWPTGPGKTTFQNIAHQITNAAGTANYVIPVLASIGPDNDMVAGVATPSLPLSSTCATTGLTAQSTVTEPDNIYSFNLR